MGDLNSQFVSYELAVELKSLGFDEECLGCYIINSSNEPYLVMGEMNQRVQADLTEQFPQTFTSSILVPLWQQAFTFLLRKLKNRELCAVLEFDGEVTLMEVIIEDSYETYNKTLASGNKESLEKLIEIVKENK